MADSARPDLFALMDAYKLLGVEYSADPSEIRRAHRRLARQHHPDRFPAGSAEQQQATTRMAAINDAYRLSRDAPLRHHRVSQAADPDTAWTDQELEDAIRRAKASRRFDTGMTVALAAVCLILVPLIGSLIPMVPAGTHPSFFVVVTLVPLWGVWLIFGRQAWHILWKIQLVMAILRILTSHRDSFFPLF